ncbi:peptide/nickel transport system permease protein [Enhydrobacter aerosaccus]|uniref:Peptide/nickel transport system permease protein n=1 Tax=Enhydrobacter aerosaccus TaxID=225324 RepID=A0A1T4R2I1_9HYPH|nr:ABC transporter permease [Enhydrobacter aerosaccus]SKA10252.1 peptide/nickel transport system permease protein [Enhydrobacter aerosaccus]
MLRFVLRRCALVLPSLLGLLVVTFLLIHAVPSDPAVAMAGDAATPEQIAHLRQQYGLDRPMWEQFGLYLGKVASFDFGESAFSHRPVALDIVQRLPATLELTFASLLLSVLIGVPLGVVAALKHNSWPDYALRIFSVLGVAVAAFWFAIMLQFLFSMTLGWLPLRGDLSATMSRPPVVTGFLLLDSLIAGRWDAFGDAVRHLFLPAVTLALGGLATIVRFTRSGVLDTLQHDFVLYERAVGYSRSRLVWIYVLRNSLTATVTQIGLLFGGLIAGGVVVEAIFDWPGIGSYTVQAILTGDRQVMLAVTLLVGAVYAMVNILVDVVHGLLDPRLMGRA